MKKLINLLRGYAQIRVEGAFPERMLNLCAQHRVSFWGVRWLDATGFLFRVSLGDVGRVEELAGRAMCQIRVESRRGAAAAALRLKQRLGFLVGVGLCLLAVGLLSRFLLVVEVTGNQSVPTAVILAELQRLGVRPGAYGPAIAERDTANRALMALPQLSYMAINISGTRAQVTVREAVTAPELLDESAPADVVAAVDGIILDIHTVAGRAMFSDGDIVARGEVLISGELDLKEPDYGTVDLGTLVVRASGTVTARTWRTLEERVPLQVGVKRYTGEEQTLYSLRLLWGELDFFENSSISGREYDKITETKDLTVLGQPLPVGITVTTLRPFVLEERAVDEAETSARLEQALRSRLAALLEQTDGKALRTDVVTRIGDGVLTVTLLAECEEQIGRTVERSDEVGRHLKE